MKNTKRQPSLTFYAESAQSAIFEELGVIFCFSQERFEEQRKEGVKYANIGSGALMPSANVDKFIKRMEDTEKESIKLIKSEHTDKAIIAYQLNNHEYGYTWDITDAHEALEPFGYTKQEVQDVARSIDWSHC